MKPELLHPALPLLASALLVPWLREWIRTALVLFAAAWTVVIIWQLPQGYFLAFTWLDWPLRLLAVDHLGRLFALLFAVLAFTGLLFCCRQATRLELVANLVHVAAALGVVLAGDLLTLAICWLVMVTAAGVVIAAAHGDAAWQAGMRFLLLHLLAGVLLLAGVIAHVVAGGSLDISLLSQDGVARSLILVALLIGVAAPPVSAWIADVLPRASLGSPVLLSAFTTQAAIYVLVRIFPGTELLIIAGWIMIVYGIVYAVLENDIRRMLGYALVAQLGLVLCLVGYGTESSLNAALAVTVLHALWIPLLFMTAGAVIYRTGCHQFSRLGGLYQSMPVTTACAIIAALTAMSVPLTGGFVSRALMLEALDSSDWLTPGTALLVVTAATVLHAGFRYPWLVFYHADSGLRPAESPWNMRLAMLLLAWLCILIGLAPCQLFALLPYATQCVPYTPANVLLVLQLFAFAALGCFLLLRWLPPQATITLDTDWFYRRLIPAWTPAWIALWARAGDLFGRGLLTLWRQTVIAVRWLLLVLARCSVRLVRYLSARLLQAWRWARLRLRK